MTLRRPAVVIACALIWCAGVAVGSSVQAPAMLHIAGVLLCAALVSAVLLWGAGRRLAVIVLVGSIALWRGAYPAPVPVVPRAAVATIAAVRSDMVERLRRALPEPHATLASGILLGDQAAPLPRAWRDRFVRSGLLHLVAASGSNVALIIEGVAALVLAAGVSLRARIAWMSAFTVGFVLLSGASASIVRAGIMAVLALGGRFAGRKSRRDIALWVSAAVMTAQDPSILSSLGFQLSVLAVAALVYVLPHVQRLTHIDAIRHPWLRAAVGEYLLASIVVTAVLQPLLLATVGGVSYIAPLMNLAVAPLVPLIMTVAALSIGASYVIPIASMCIGWLAYPPLAFVIASIRWGSEIPYGYAPDASMPVALALGCYALLAAACIAATRRERSQRDALVAAILRA